MTGRPRVSVIVPVHNAERYLRAAIESVLSQSFGDFELLAMDDGSRDGSLEVLRTIEGEDARMRVFSQANAGISRALNALIERSRGDYLARMDGDDLCLPHRLGEQVATLDRRPDVVALGSWVRIVDPDGYAVHVVETPAEHEAIERFLWQGNGGMLPHPAVTMRAEAVRRVGGYRPEFDVAEDRDLFLRLAEVGRLANAQEVLLEYRHHLSNANNTRVNQRLAANDRLVTEACERRGLSEPPFALQPQRLRTPGEQMRRWAWARYGGGHRAAAAAMAWRSLRAEPASAEAWRLLACCGRDWLTTRSGRAATR